MAITSRLVVLLLISSLLISSIEGRCGLRPQQLGVMRQSPEQFAQVKAKFDLLLSSLGVDPLRIPSAPCQKLIAGSRGSFGPGCELPGRQALLRPWTNWTIVAPRRHCVLLRTCLGCLPCSPQNNVFMLVTPVPSGHQVLLETCEHSCSSPLLLIPHNHVYVTFIPEVGGSLRPALDHVRINFLGIPSRHRGNFISRRRVSAWLAQSCESQQVLLSGDSVPSNVQDVDFGDVYPLFRVYMPGLPSLVSPKSRLEPYLRFWVPYSGPAKPRRTLTVRWRPAPIDLMQRPSGPAAAISVSNERCGNWTSTGDKLVELDTCQFELAGNSGTFYSPGFPANYPSLVRCQWTVRAPETSTVLLKVCGFSHGGGCCDRSDKVIFKEHPHQEVSAMILSCWERNIFYYSPKVSGVTLTLTSGDWRGWSDQGPRNFWVEYFVLEQDAIFDLKHLSCSEGPVHTLKSVQLTLKPFGENLIKAEEAMAEQITKLDAQYQLTTVDSRSQENVTGLPFDEQQLASVANNWLIENVTQLGIDEQLSLVDSWSQENGTQLGIDEQLSLVDSWSQENGTQLGIDEHLSLVDSWSQENGTQLGIDEQLSLVDSWSQVNDTQLGIDEQLSLVDSWSQENDTQLGIDEQLSFVDSWSQENDTQLGIDEQLSLVDSWSQENGTQLGIDEQLSLVDSWSQENDTQLGIDEQLSLVDSWSQENGTQLGIDEQLSFVDSWSQENDTQLGIDEQLSLVDSWSQENDTQLGIDEQLSLVDSWSQENGTQLGIDEQLSFVDSWSQENDTQLGIDEQLSLVDSLSQENDTQLGIDEQLSFVDSWSQENDTQLGIDEQLSLVDSWSQENGTQLGIDEQLSLVDSLSQENDTQLGIDEHLSLVDSLSQENGTQLGIDEQLSLVDSWSQENDTQISFDEQQSLVDNVLPENVIGLAFDLYTSAADLDGVVEVQRNLDYDWSTIGYVTNSVEFEVLSRSSMSTTMLEEAFDPNIGQEMTAGIFALKPRDRAPSKFAASPADLFGHGVSMLAEAEFPASEMTSISTTMQGGVVVMEEILQIGIEKTTLSKSPVISPPESLASSTLLSTLEPSKHSVFEALTVHSDASHDRAGVSCPNGIVNTQNVETPELETCRGSLQSADPTIAEVSSLLPIPDDFLSSNEISAVSAEAYLLSEGPDILTKTSIPAPQTASDLVFDHPDKFSNFPPHAVEPTRRSEHKLIPERGLRAGPRFVWGHVHGPKGKSVHPGPYKPKEYTWFEVSLSSAVRGKRQAQYFNELVKALLHHLVSLMNISSGDYKDDFITIIPKDMNWVVSDSKFLAKFHVFLERDAGVTRAELLQFLEERASKIINSQNSSLEILGIEVRDVNECETEEHLCDYHAACHNTQGSYMCQCDDGYTSLDSNWMGTQCMGVIYDDVEEATPSIALMAVILGAVACGLFLIVMLALIVATMVQRRWQQASAVNTVLGTAIYPRLNCSDLSQFTVSPPPPSLWRSPASPTSRSGEERYQEAESCGCGWHPNSPAATRMHVCKR